MLLQDIIKKAAPSMPQLLLDKYCPLLDTLMPRYEIITPLRQRHFLAQLLHESGGFRYVRELASGVAYEGRKDLGNTQQGDGLKFKGRGLIQITGRANYARVSRAIFGNDTLLDYPEILEQPHFAVESACWFWKVNNLNALADKNDIEAVTKRINGGLNGIADRKKYFEKLTS